MFRLQRNQKKAYYENLRKGDEEANVQLFEAMNVKDNTVAKAPEPQPVSFAVCYLILSDALLLISSKSVVTIQCCAMSDVSHNESSTFVKTSNDQ